MFFPVAIFFFFVAFLHSFRCLGPSSNLRQFPRHVSTSYPLSLNPKPSPGQAGHGGATVPGRQGSAAVEELQQPRARAGALLLALLTGLRVEVTET